MKVVKRTLIRVKRENEREEVKNNTEIASEQPKEGTLSLSQSKAEPSICRGCLPDTSER